MSQTGLGKPLFIFDGDCAFCRRWVGRWRGVTGDLAEFQPFQQAAARFPDIPRSELERASILIEPDGKISRGARAVFRILDIARDRRCPLWMYDRVPGFAPLANAVYRFIATHRNLFDKLDLWFIGPQEQPSTYLLSRWLFLRALGIVYLIAFISYWVQIDGLVGSKGILPIAPLLNNVATRYGPERFWLLPTLAWINHSDWFLHALCGGGMALAMLLIIGVVPVLALAGLWALYLSVVVAGQTFFNFQWDVLLLEAGVLAVFFAPWQVLPRPSREFRPSRIVLWLIRWLAFRVMFLSGLVKLTYGDITWRNWTALDYHYFTQPIPIWTSWWIHHAPHWFDVFSLVFMFYAELIAPFFIFGPRRLRIIAFFSINLLQLNILASGNYGFFNLLTIALTFVLVDDIFWPRWLRYLIPRPDRPQPPQRWRQFPVAITAPLAGVILIITSMQIADSFNRGVRWPGWMASLREHVSPLRRSMVTGFSES